MDELISVIVPVYKVERYLDQCVRSIVDQTYRNLEIILVDDGSPDRCPQMCDEWAKRDSRIRVIHQENSGVSVARNAGLDIARGDYICFVDSDDWIDERYVQLLLSAMRENQASISICRIRYIKPNQSIISKIIDDIEIKAYSAEDAMEALIRGGVFLGVVWDKLFARSVVESIRFHPGRRHEDEFFVHRCFDKADRIVLIEIELYNYLQRESSFMHIASLAHLDMLDAILDRCDLIEQKYPKLRKQAKLSFCVMCVSHYRQALQNVEIEAANKKEYLARIKSYRKKVTFTVKEVLSYGPKGLTYIFFSKCCIHLFSWILNLRRGGIE